MVLFKVELENWDKTTADLLHFCNELEKGEQVSSFPLLYCTEKCLRGQFRLIMKWNELGEGRAEKNLWQQFMSGQSPSTGPRFCCLGSVQNALRGSLSEYEMSTLMAKVELVVDQQEWLTDLLQEQNLKRWICDICSRRIEMFNYLITKKDMSQKTVFLLSKSVLKGNFEKN